MNNKIAPIVMPLVHLLQRSDLTWHEREQIAQALSCTLAADMIDVGMAAEVATSIATAAAQVPLPEPTRSIEQLLKDLEEKAKRLPLGGLKPVFGTQMTHPRRLPEMPTFHLYQRGSDAEVWEGVLRNCATRGVQGKAD